MINTKTKRTVFSALFLALAFVLPFLTGQIPEIGSMLCPMHIPVLLCGFLCGAPHAALVGFCAPLLRSFILGMPPLFPTALCMAFELAAYGAVSGIMYKLLSEKFSDIHKNSTENGVPKKNTFASVASCYASLITAMLVGRCVWGLAMLCALSVSGSAFTFAAFAAGAFLNAVPGIILQLLLIPIIVRLAERKAL